MQHCVYIGLFVFGHEMETKLFDLNESVSGFYTDWFAVLSMHKCNKFDGKLVEILQLIPPLFLSLSVCLSFMLTEALTIEPSAIDQYASFRVTFSSFCRLFHSLNSSLLHFEKCDIFVRYHIFKYSSFSEVLLLPHRYKYILWKHSQAWELLFNCGMTVKNPHNDQSSHQFRRIRLNMGNQPVVNVLNTSNTQSKPEPSNLDIWY